MFAERKAERHIGRSLQILSHLLPFRRLRRRGVSGTPVPTDAHSPRKPSPRGQISPVKRGKMSAEQTKKGAASRRARWHGVAVTEGVFLYKFFVFYALSVLAVARTAPPKGEPWCSAPTLLSSRRGRVSRPVARMAKPDRNLAIKTGCGALIKGRRQTERGCFAL